MTQYLDPLIRKEPIFKVPPELELMPWTTARKVDLGQGTVTHSFLVMPDCPYPLIVRDLLRQLGTTITFSETEATLDLKNLAPPIPVNCPLSDEYRLTGENPDDFNELGADNPLFREWVQKGPNVWVETNPLGLASHKPPMI